MTPFQAYVMYGAVRSHFTSKGYDYFKYNGKMKRLTPDSFNSRKDGYQYTRLANHKDPLGLVVVNHVHRNTSWIGDIFDDTSKACHAEYTKYIQAPSYHYANELKSVLVSFEGDLNTMLKPVDSQLPPLVMSLMKNCVRYETVVIMNDTLDFIPVWDRLIADTIVWPKIKTKLVKVKPFYNFDWVKLKEVTRKVCINNMMDR